MWGYKKGEIGLTLIRGGNELASTSIFGVYQRNADS